MGLDRIDKEDLRRWWPAAAGALAGSVVLWLVLRDGDKRAAPSGGSDVFRVKIDPVLASGSSSSFVIPGGVPMWEAMYGYLEPRQAYLVRVCPSACVDAADRAASQRDNLGMTRAMWSALGHHGWLLPPHYSAGQRRHLIDVLDLAARGARALMNDEDLDAVAQLFMEVPTLRSDDLRKKRDLLQRYLGALSRDERVDALADWAMWLNVPDTETWHKVRVEADFM